MSAELQKLGSEVWDHRFTLKHHDILRTARRLVAVLRKLWKRGEVFIVLHLLLLNIRRFG